MITGGINIIPHSPPAVVAEIAQEAERLGLARCWMMDEGLDTRDVFVCLTTAALRTSTIKLGTGITNPYTRHAGVTAATIATLDELSGGRGFLGIGAGGSLTLGPLDIERRKPITAAREMIQTTRALFAGEQINFQGEQVRFKNARLEYARPGIPIWVAGRGKQMLSLAGELADGVSLDFIHRDFVGENIDVVTSAAEKAGHARPRINYSTNIVTSDAMLEEMRPFSTFTLVDSPPEVKKAIGITPDEVENIRSTMNSQGLKAAGKFVKEEWMRPFMLIGSVEECATELKRFIGKLPVDEITHPIHDPESAPERMETLAKVIALVNS
jgi:5,10-methylenetetrahydromethanopterin reductase